MATNAENIRVFHKRLLEAMDDKGVNQVDLVKATGIPKGSISQYYLGQNMPYSPRIAAIAKALDVNPIWLMGENVPKKMDGIPGIEPAPATRSVPLLGTIACGEPILAEENIQDLVQVPSNIKCDFVLRCKGDSMTGARIYDGDIVYIRQQPEVENGQIAAVLIDGEATLKRVYVFADHLILRPENPAYKELVFDNRNDVRILGLAVAFTGMIK